MGIGPIALTLYRQLAEDGVLKPGQSVMEFGSQDLYVSKCVPMVWELFEIMGVERPASLEPSSKAMMERLGFKYECIDADGRHGAHRIDLNERLEYASIYDVVTNHGTTEHVFDQANCFRAMHDLCKPGGVMIHCVPMRGYAEHCFYCYQPGLFDELAKANEYEILEKAIVFDEGSDAGGKQGNLLLSVVMRRRISAPFRVPFQTSRYARPQ